jgi:hypothetical protein
MLVALGVGLAYAVPATDRGWLAGWLGSRGIGWGRDLSARTYARTLTVMHVTTYENTLGEPSLRVCEVPYWTDMGVLGTLRSSRGETLGEAKCKMRLGLA